MNLSINIAMISTTQSSLLLLHALHCSAPSERVDNLDWVVRNQSVKVLVDVEKLESFSKQTFNFSHVLHGKSKHQSKCPQLHCDLSKYTGIKAFIISQLPDTVSTNRFPHKILKYRNSLNSDWLYIMRWHLGEGGGGGGNTFFYTDY